MDHSDSRAFIDALFGSSSAQSQERTSGVVAKVDPDGTAWVRLTGSETLTPCTRTTAIVKPGDSVSVIVKNSRASIEGNYTAPATDNTVASSALKRVIAAQKAALSADTLAANAFKSAATTKALASSAQKAAQDAAEAVTPVLGALEEIKGEEETFIAGLEKKINTMTAGFASENDLAAVQKELETSISQTAEKIQMIASSDTALQLSEEVQAKLQQANEELAVANVRLDAAREAYADAQASYNDLITSKDATEEQIAEAAQAVTDALNALDLAQETHDNVTKIIAGIKSNYTSKTEFELLAEGLKLLFSSESDDRDSYITMTSGGIRLGDVGNADAYLNIASDKIAFVQNSREVATIEDDAMRITRVKTTDELAVNDWRWKQRENGNISFKWRRERIDD